MPRFFDDYSNTYLTHDSAAGRKQQRRGWKFRENFKLHYDDYLQDWRKGGMGLASAQQAYVRAKGKEDPMIPPMPPGWKEDVDEATGISFYYQVQSGERTWVRPGFIPPPPGGPPPRGGGSFRGGNNGPPPNHRPPFQQQQQQQGPPFQQQQQQGQPSFQRPPPPFPPGGPPPPPGQYPPPQYQQGPPRPNYQ